jgi:hypothetical protein
LTLSRRRRYGSRPLVRPLPPWLAAAAIAALAACGASTTLPPAPPTLVRYPVGIAIAGDQLLVVSSNFDGTYSEKEGGAVTGFTLPPSPGQPLATTGVNIGSLGGEIAIADATACELDQTLALVPSRTTGELYRIGIGADGTLSCGAGCALPMRSDMGDPYGVTVACPPGGRKRAFVSALRTPNLEALVAMIDLSSWQVQVGDFGSASARSLAYQAERDRVFFTSLEAGLTAPLRWIDLGGDCRIDVALTDPTACPAGVLDLFPIVRGADLRGIALSNARADRSRRAYVAARVFDADLAASIGARPAGDVGGVLLVLDLLDGPDGRAEPKLVDWVDMGIGVSEVAVLPQRPAVPCASDPAGCVPRDLVAVTSGDDGLLSIYDDEVGSVRAVFARDPATGIPVLGRYPYGLAVGPTADPGTVRVYVGAFNDGWVSAVDVPLAAPASATLVKLSNGQQPPPPWRIGAAQ